MADEKRRLIYELLVEAKGAEKAKDDLDGFGKKLGALGGIAKGAMGILAAGFAVKGIGEALDELTKFNQAMGTLGVSGAAATTALHDVQDISFKTMTSMQGVAEVYKEAVQLQGTLGRSTEDAGRTTDAFIRIMAAEGKSAQAAGAAISTLNFALEAGVLPAKQFNSLMKDSPTFARAAQEALGMTTQQLVELAKGGDLGAESLTKIVLALEHIGEQTDAAVTVGGVIDALKTLTTTMVQAIAEGANFNAQITGGQDGWTSFLEQTRGFFQFIGGAIAVVNNFLQEMVDVALFFVKVLANPLDIKKTWAEFNDAVNQDLVDMGAGFVHMWDGLHSDFSELRSESAQAARDAEQYAKDLDAIREAKRKDYTKAFGDSFDKSVEKWKKAQADAPAQWAAFYEKEKKEREKRDKDAMDDYIAQLEEKGRLSAAAAKRRAEDEKEIQKGLKEFAEKNEKDLQKSIEETSKVRIEGLSRQYFQEIDVMAEGAYVLQDAFADLFTGGIRSAREFFQVILRGLAQIFAQIAAQKLAQGIMDAIGGAMGAAGGGWAKMAAGAGYSAKGNVFQGGHQVAFAQGGVVNGPTMFPMARGGVGIMGEAGPEAVMPLKRMSNGKLGVAGAMPNIQIINQTGVQARARVQQHADRLAIVMEAAHLGASIAEDRFNRSLRSGYGPAAQSVQSVYGLRRKV